MTTWTGAQVATFWVEAGGPASRAVEWVAIAIGESGLDDAALSPAGAIGLWQIMPFNAPTYGYSAGQLYEPAVNARVAVQMSGGGTNCAAWDSCYADIYRSGRYSFLSWPEAGSADYNNLATAAAEVGSDHYRFGSQQRQPGTSDTLSGAVADITAVGSRMYPPLTRRAVAVSAGAQRLYRPVVAR